MQRKEKQCVRCGEVFLATGNNCKRCEPCRKVYNREYCKDRWHRTYVKKGYNQKGENNNHWKGGKSPQYYQEVAFKHHGDKCIKCSAKAVLVHHIDGNRSNSSPDNLEVLCKRCHQLHHDCTSNLPKVVIFKDRSCVRCRSRFLPTGPRSKYCLDCGGKGVKV